MNTPSQVKREKLLRIIEALLQKIPENGCTEAEAIAAAEKAQRIMEKEGLSLADLEVVDSVIECEQSQVKVDEKREHPVINVAPAIANLTDTEWWYRQSHRWSRQQDGYRLIFFGLPEDVRIATYLARIIRDAMNLEWRLWWAVNCKRRVYSLKHRELTTLRPNTARKNFMWGMGGRISSRLYEMKREREARNNDCKAIVLRKKDIIEAALKATGITFSAGRLPSGPFTETFDPESYGAGQAAGMRTSLNAGELKT